MTEQNTILVVDDSEINRRLLGTLCENLGCHVLTAGSGPEAIQQTVDHKPDLILLDVMMPGMSGFEVVEHLKSDHTTEHIPVIMVTALDSRGDRIAGIAKGADDFLTKPIDYEELELRVRNNLKVKRYHDLLKQQSTILEDKVASRTRDLQTAFERLSEAHAKISEGYVETIYRLTLMAEFKDVDTGSHIKRISRYTRELAAALSMSPDFIEVITYASTMHDIGKIGIPDSVLLKPGELTPQEWDMMKTHSIIGAKVIGNSESPYLKMAEEIALTHHERWDGSGYPAGLKGEEIPLSGRIMNIVDQYDALRNRRLYKPALSHEQVVKIIVEGDGRTMPSHFDPAILQTFRAMHERFNEIYESLKE